MGALLDYHFYTGDKTYNAAVTEALLYQVGPNRDYMPPNQTKTEGNDDQAFWGMAAMSAAEQNFPNPPKGQPQWLALAQAVFNGQAMRWDNSTCGGGLRWQIFTFNTGYNYKNAISNGCFFNLAARLAMYTGNQTYADWAERAWDWVNSINLMDDQYRVFDGSDDTKGCSQINQIQWTYNNGVFLLGAANMYNWTNGSTKWQTRINGLLNASEVFYNPNVTDVMQEVCEPSGKCNTDQESFKAYLSQWMAASTKVAPFTYDFIAPKLQASANAAAQQCSGGTDGVTCGLSWVDQDQWDGTYGIGQQLAALSVIQANLITDVRVPLKTSTGGTSPGDNSAGTIPLGGSPGKPLAPPATTGEKAGAGILTVLSFVLVGGGLWFMFT
ncbi:hydrolase 76 protein [Bachmanniomyces sp. S44760]|nr:hydrolase 76 protein [Bachmanniomyces sp. S44760]